MRPELEELNSRLDAMSREDLILSIRRLMEECSEKDAMLEIDSAASTEMSLQFRQIRDENSALKKENRELLRQNRKLTDQLQMRNKDLFGRKSERSSGIVDAVLEGAPKDPLEETPAGPEEEAPGTEETAGKASASELEKVLHPTGSHKTKGKKSRGKRRSDLDGLPTKTFYDLDVGELDRKYGEGNWRIAFWRQEDTLESVHTVQYHKCTFRPVISVGLEHDLVCPYPCGKILPGSLASSSMIAELMYQKVVQCVPSYRMEADLLRSGVPLSRQTITNWINRFSHDLFAIAADHMAMLLCLRRYNQCDETTYEVIRDGRKAGAKSFMWVHTTSELDPARPIIVYRFELTRATDHLRSFYGDTGFAGNITSDAYCSYDLLAEEYPDIQGSGCLMHVRRRFFYAALLINIRGKDPEKFRDLPEIRALALIDDINDAERPLKTCTPEERLRIRQSVVKEKADAFFDYIKTLDADDPSYSDKLKDAIHYSLNQEGKLRRFLDDPMIPADNGFCERCIKPLATARRNWLFSCSIEGAEAAAILFTLIETAKANQAHPYYYLKYLLETLPKQKVCKENPFLDDCMPWSESYRVYEKEEKRAAMRFFEDQCPPERPRTPRKTGRCG
ncbi:MAG: IS66 family transposase [Lachnospiraceae bacterium]|nr:IS66 family transposase [Lachnospiraceae bacterium]